jgi:hypothetical protein
MQADLEALRVAELYASHPLLRYMPVPRLRVPEVDLDIPVVIKEVEEPRAGESPRGGPPIAQMRQAFDQVLATQLKKQAISLTPAIMKKLQSALDARMTTLDQPTEIAIDVNRFADDLTATSARTLLELGPASAFDPHLVSNLEAALKDEARLAFLKLRKPPPRLSVLVTTQDIREAGPTEVITRLTLKLSEQAVEWTTIESHGSLRDRLVPE